MSVTESAIDKDKVEITDGPSALHLLVSLMETNKSPRKPIDFTSGLYSQFEICISLLTQANQTGDEFHFEGWLRRSKRGNIHGFYNVRTRRGWFKRGHKYSVSAGLC